MQSRSIPSIQRALARGIAALFSLTLLACTSGLAEAKSDFKKGRYAEAKEQLVALEADEKAWDEQRRAEYALYRGLTHNALGDRGAANLWLKEARALADAHPGILSADDTTRLNLALESLSPDVAPATP